MPSEIDAQAAELLEEYVRALTSGRAVDVTELLSRCAADQRERLQDAIAGADLLRSSYEPYLVRPELVERSQRDIAALRAARQRLDGARSRLAECLPRGILRGQTIQGLLESILGVRTQPAGPAAEQPLGSPAFEFRGARKIDKAAFASQARLEAAAREAAREADRVWQRAGAPDPPIDPRAIADMLGIIVIEHDTEGCDGCAMLHEDLSAIVVNAQVTHEGRKRFTLAHEIGHCLLHGKWHQFIHESLRDIECSWASEHELGANVFASELLMPAELVTADCGHEEPSFDAIDSLAGKYGVSRTAAARRLVDTSDFACALLCVLEDTVRWFTKSSEFPKSYRIRRGEAPPHSSDAASLLAGEDERGGYWETDAAWWLEGRHVPDDLVLLEDSRLIYGDHVLTLLFMKEVPEGA